MDLTGYLIERSRLETIAIPFALVVAPLSLLVMGACLLPAGRRHARRLVQILAGCLAAGFIVLAYYHLRIYQTVILPNPGTGAPAGRYMVPLWIEGEKLFFVTLLLGLFAVVLGRRQGPVAPRVGAMFGSLSLTVALLSNPFASPLPDLHRQLTETAAALAQPDASVRMQAFGQAFGQMQYFYNAAYMWIHPPLLFTSYAAFAVSFLACLLMLSSSGSDSDQIAYDYAKLGYIALTFGILIGYPWAITAWKNSPWWWSPKINMALMLWFLYTGYLHSRLYLRRRGMYRTTAILGVACFVALVLTYLTTYVVPGAHSVA